MPLTVYVIYKQGVYGHGVHGVARQLGDAVQLANTLAQKDTDNYHSWAVYDIPLGEASSRPDRDGYMEQKPVYVIRHEKGI